MQYDVHCWFDLHAVRLKVRGVCLLWRRPLVMYYSKRDFSESPAAGFKDPDTHLLALPRSTSPSSRARFAQQWFWQSESKWVLLQQQIIGPQTSYIVYMSIALAKEVATGNVGQKVERWMGLGCSDHDQMNRHEGTQFSVVCRAKNGFPLPNLATKTCLGDQ